MTLSDLEGRDAKCQSFPNQSFEQEQQIWNDSSRGEGTCFSGSDTSHIKGAGNSVLKNFGPLLRTYSSQIRHGNTWSQGRVAPGVRNVPYIKQNNILKGGGVFKIFYWEY